MSILGVVASLALPPAFMLLAAAAFIPFLITAAKAKTVWQSAIIFWSFAFGWFTASLYWISASLFVDISWEILILPFSLFALPAFLSLFWGCAGILVFLSGRTVVSRLVFCALWIGVAEIFRSILLTGFPWNAPAHLILANEYLSQIASVIGQNGASFLVLLTLVAFCFLYLRFWKTGLIILLPFMISFGFGVWRLDHSVPMSHLDTKKTSEMLIRIVQPNVQQSQRWKAEFKDKQIEDLFALSMSKAAPVSLIIWPEAAYPAIWPNVEKQFLQSVQSAISDDEQLLTGMLRFGQEKKLYNSALLFSDNGSLIAKSDKQKRVPFGEYIPFRNNFLFQKLKIFGNAIDISAGPNKGLIYTRDNIALRVFICYEIIFPNLLSSHERPDVIINLTNDAWFGNTFGPYQHLSQSRIRAIEEGLPLVRVANTGISAAFNYKGEMLGKIGLLEKGILDVALPLHQQITIYSQFRWKIIIFIVFLISTTAVLLDLIFIKRQKP